MGFVRELDWTTFNIGIYIGWKEKELILGLGPLLIGWEKQESPVIFEIYHDKGAK